MVSVKHHLLLLLLFTDITVVEVFMVVTYASSVLDRVICFGIICLFHLQNKWKGSRLVSYKVQCRYFV